MHMIDIDCVQLRERVDKIVNDQRAIYESKVQRKAERRQAAKRKREVEVAEIATSGRRRRVLS